MAEYSVGVENDMYIKSRRSSSTPAREEYIGGRRRGVGQKAEGLLIRRCQSRRLGSTEDHIPNDVVTSDPIAVATMAVCAWRRS